MDREDMSEVNFKKDSSKITTVQRHFVQKIQDYNVSRAAKFNYMNRRAKLMGTGLGLTALSIYFYTMYAVRQEHFLDDFEVPEQYKAQLQNVQ